MSSNDTIGFVLLFTLHLHGYSDQKTMVTRWCDVPCDLFSSYEKIFSSCFSNNFTVYSLAKFHCCYLTFYLVRTSRECVDWVRWLAYLRTEINVYNIFGESGVCFLSYFSCYTLYFLGNDADRWWHAYAWGRSYATNVRHARMRYEFLSW